MTKNQLIEVVNLIALTLPFLIITATFIGLAYVYGNTYNPFAIEGALEHANLAYTDLP